MRRGLKKYFAEYERWMLARPGAQSESTARPSFRDRLKAEVEGFVGALRDGHVFEPYKFGHETEAEACNTSSVTI